MKLLLRTLPVLALFLLVLSSCGKESMVQADQMMSTTADQSSLPQKDAIFIPIDEAQNCGASIRITITESGVSERQEYAVREVVSGSQLWWGTIASMECGFSTIESGIWYNLPLVNNVPYKFTFVVKANCINPIFGRYCNLSLKVGNKIYNYTVSTDEPLFFSKVDCGIILNG